MTNFILYSLEIAISLALFYSAYWIFLRNETFFKLNRVYLLASVFISLLTPLLNIGITANTEKNSFITDYFLLPIERYEEQILGTINHKNDRAAAPNTPANKTRWKAARTGQVSIIESNPAQAVPLSAAEKSDAGQASDWLTILLVVYFIGAALLFIRFMANLIWIFGYVLKYKPQQLSGMKVIRSEKNNSPFSFLNLIFLSHKEYPEEELNKIIAHEKVHIRQKHSIDLILFELLLVFQWFNPFVWMYKRAIKINHEYLADHGTLTSGIDLDSYQYSLLNQVLRENSFEIASNYNLSIKKRINMMMKKRSPKMAALKLSVALPILAFLVSAFALSSTAPKKEDPQNQTGEHKMIVTSDSTIKKVNVPVEYLKELEGEYHSTNEPWGVRKIRFEVVVGALVGHDNGYRYRLIPVGDGKFINPDDKATLVFDTKNKEAITLLLFGKVHLTKIKLTRESVDFPKKSVAFSVANVLEKDGIPAALVHYNSIKQLDNCDLNEYEMNLVGYMLLEQHKAKEAAAMFKLNVDAFPNSFNVYDSYGEALMALGDKTLALDNYVKSVRLNPGSKSGIKVLKEAGINTDAIIQIPTVPIEYLKLLAGEYHSTNESWGVRKIRFTVENGVLAGNDHGYHYTLIPRGDGKFINPDDGASLVFDTKDKNAITLVLFGKVNLKKLKASEEAIKEVPVSKEFLKLLAGEYHSTNAPNGVRKITFVEENGILVGNDNGYRFKLVPVGEGKFINPDDYASIVFDTRNKSTITLLLFGKINLKKVN